MQTTGTQLRGAAARLWFVLPEPTVMYMSCTGGTAVRLLTGFVYREHEPGRECGRGDDAGRVGSLPGLCHETGSAT